MVGEPQKTVSLSKECLALFASDRPAFLEMLHEEITQYQDYGGLLRQFMTETREEFDEDTINIEKDDITVDDSGEGTVQFSFYGYVHYGCRDMMQEVDHWPEIRFKIDFEKETLTYYVDTPPEREMDEI